LLLEVEVQQERVLWQTQQQVLAQVVLENLKVQLIVIRQVHLMEIQVEHQLQ
jgi:hypothetical protein